MVLHQRNLRAFSGLFTIPNRFQARAGFGPDLVGQFTTQVTQKLGKHQEISGPIIANLLSASNGS